MPVKDFKDIPSNNVNAGEKTEMQVLISSDEGPTFAMRRFVIHPGGGMPSHTNTVEHEQFVLKGCAKVGIGEDVYSIAFGNVLFIPAGIPHWYQNDGEVDFEFLCLVPNKQDVITVLSNQG